MPEWPAVPVHPKCVSHAFNSNVQKGPQSLVQLITLSNLLSALLESDRILQSLTFKMPPKQIQINEGDE